MKLGIGCSGLRRVVTFGAAAALLMTVAACSSSNGDEQTGGGISEDASATLLVWTDATRQPGFEQFQKSHPDVKMKIETYDPAALLTKIQLFNRTEKGWPDVVFSQLPSDAAAMSSELYDFTQPLDSLISEDVKQGFGEANADCMIAGQLYCLKNDLAQSVLWYNKPMMAEFGYEVPTTWEEYKALGLRVAEEHPGYIIGTAGFKFVYNDYLWPSGCPLQNVTDSNQVHIDTEDPACTRVAEMLDPLLEAGSVSRQGPFDPEVIKLGQQQKILMLPAASWFGDFVFKPDSSFKTPEGVLAAAPYPSWDGAENFSGSSGGGVYMVSRHSKNVKGAAEMVEWMATSSEYQATAPTYPAYGPAATAWSERLGEDPFYAENPFPVLEQQASLVNPVASNTRYSVDDSVTATIVQSVRSGGKVAEGLPTLQTQLTQLAQTVGYAVQ